MVPYIATTENITVTVRPVYLDRRSNLVLKRFVFGYYVHIENNSKEEVQLLRRHWIIQDADGQIQEVEGEGVVGEQPIIQSDTSFHYDSYCVLETFQGSMEGTYLMQRHDGEQFRVLIPRFNLIAAAN